MACAFRTLRAPTWGSAGPSALVHDGGQPSFPELGGAQMEGPVQNSAVRWSPGRGVGKLGFW